MSGARPQPDGYKGIVLLKRREGATKEEFLDWVVNVHSRFSRSLPEVLKYTGSLVVAPGPRTEFQDGEPPFDLINEIWCRDRATLDQAYAKLVAMGGPTHTLSGAGKRISLLCEEYVFK